MLAGDSKPNQGVVKANTTQMVQLELSKRECGVWWGLHTGCRSCCLRAWLGATVRLAFGTWGKITPPACATLAPCPTDCGRSRGPSLCLCFLQRVTVLCAAWDTGPEVQWTGF